MNKEQYVTFEVAKLLKEKGFAWRVFNFYDEHGGFSEHIGSVYSLYNWNYPTKDEYGSQYCSAPTQQMACRWLREEKSVWITHRPLDYDYGVDGLAYIKTPDNEWLCAYTCTKDSVEDAIETALEYALANLI